MIHAESLASAPRLRYLELTPPVADGEHFDLRAFDFVDNTVFAVDQFANRRLAKFWDDPPAVGKSP